MQILDYIYDFKSFEFYLTITLFLFTVWYIVSTVRYYKGEKRKIKHLHRFAQNGEIEAQKDLADCYEKGYMVKQNKRIAAFWKQKVYFATTPNKEVLKKSMPSRMLTSIISTIKKLFI